MHPVYYIPLQRNEKFVGRKDVLEMLKKMLFRDKYSRKVALVGLGGVGKTQVALEVAYWAKDHQPDYSVLWISALSNDSINQAFTEIAKQLAVQIDNEQGLKKSLRRHLDSNNAGKLFLIVDNADDPDILLGPSNDCGGLYDYLPESEDSLILFTTRLRDTAIGVAATDIIDLHDMSKDEATAFLYETLINKELLQDKRGTEKLLQELAYFPLAIAQAAAYLNQNRTSITDYLVLLRNTELSLMSRESHDTTRYQEQPNAVATTLLVSFSLICRSNSHAATLLSFMSCIEPQAIPESIFPQPQIKEEMISAISILCEYGVLVRFRRGMDSMFDMPPLVHSATRVWVQNQHIVKEIRTKAIQHLISVFSSSKKEDLLKRKEYLPHAQHALRISKDDQSAERFDLFYHVGLCLHAEQRVEDAIIALEQTYRFRKQYLPEESNIRLASERALGKAYLENRRIKEAIRLFQHVVDIRKMTSQSMDDRFTSEFELARAYYEDQQTEKSIEILERSVLAEKHSLTETNEQLEAEQLLASAYLDAKRTKEAIRILERVVFVQKKTLAEEDRVRLKTESVLASAYIDDSRHKEAIRILENVEIIWDKTTAVDDHDRLTSAQLLAYAYLEFGQTSTAILILENVVSIRAKTLKADDTERLTSEHELAYAYMQIGRVRAAIDILQNVVRIENKMDLSEKQRRISRDLLAEARRSEG
ncbi:P-loop containing nucleoside triphosphate hydrolase protein [Xylaria arbuscula]|nr:P-loop containing nucleoside triphosphate hydrolase protein [Xylaria arbuscula]